MADANKPNPKPPADAKADPKAMTAAEAAKLVKRTVTTVTEKKGADGELQKVVKTERVPVTAGEVLAFKDQGDYVVVVTTDGQKLRSDDAE